MRMNPLNLTLLAVALAANFTTTAARAQANPAPQQPANEQVIVPQVDRRDVKVPRIPSNDFEAGLFTGTYATQNFGSSLATGVRLGYHVTEDFFFEGVYGRTKVSDETLRRISAGGSVLVDPSGKLSYYNLSAGYNLLPGEVFIGKGIAKASAIYLIAGVGTTRFEKQRLQTINFGLGVRLFLADWAAVQVDMRDHMFSLDLLGKRENTHNLELTTGVTFFF
jgi:outer membrane beta-barrel protein